MTTTTFTYTTGYTNLGALGPTSFPSDCLESLWDMNTPQLIGTVSYQTQGCAISTCCPSSHFYTEAWAWMTSYYSPGVCPSQYRSCSPPPASYTTQLLSQPGETIVFCCPTNYACPYTTYGPGLPWFGFCQSLMYTTTTSVIVVDNLFDQSTLSTRGYTIPPGFEGQYQLAYPIQVRQGGTGTGVPPYIAASQTGSISPPTGTTTTNSPSAQPLLSAGAIAGIAVGAFLGGALLIAVAIRLTFKMTLRKRIHNASQFHTGEASTAVYKPELDGRGVPIVQQTPFVPELQAGSWQGAELAGNTR
jgi:hypothetical protein